MILVENGDLPIFPAPNAAVGEAKSRQAANSKHTYLNDMIEDMSGKMPPGAKVASEKQIKDLRCKVMPPLIDIHEAVHLAFIPWTCGMFCVYRGWWGS